MSPFGDAQVAWILKSYEHRDSAVKPRSIGNLLNTGLPKDVKSCTMR